MRLKVATWNVQSCSRGIAGVARVLKALDADVVALQEVDRGTARAGGEDQAQRLGDAAGYGHVRFFKAVAWGRGDYGIALLSRRPLAEERVGILPNEDGLEPRIHATALLDTGEAQISVHLTHLTHVQPRLRLAQARRIVERVEACAAPHLLLGDFNALPGSAPHRALCRALDDAFRARGAGPGGTYPLPWILPTVRIDYVFASRDVGIVSARVERTRASDHHALSAEVEIPPTAAGLAARRAG